MQDIPVASAATAYDDPVSGVTTILVFHQGLWFGDSIPNSLINPNQCRHLGFEICDDPFDPHQSLGIRDSVGWQTLPLEYQESIIFAETRAPTREELNDQSIQQVVMTSDATWNPVTTGNRPLPPEEEARKRLIGSVHHYGTCNDAGTEVVGYGEKIDNPLASCSTAYCGRALADRMMSAVRVASSITTTGESPYTGKGTTIQAVSLRERHSRVTAEEISRKFYCGVETAQNTLKATTQMGIRHAVHPLSRRYRTDIMQTRVRRLKETWFADTMFSKVKSLRGNSCAEVFTNGKFIHLEPMEKKSNAGDAIGTFAEEVGVPDTLVFDGSREQCGPKTEFMKFIRRNHVNWRNTEPYSHWQNRAEDQIKEIRKKWRALRQRRKVPKRLWDYAGVHLARLSNLTAKGPNRRTAWEEITGDTPDISEYLDFEFYDWIWYWDTPGDEDSPKIGRWLGVAHRIGSAMCFYVLTQ
jgi:hypothetical protein